MSNPSMTSTLLARATVSPKGFNQDSSVCARHKVPGYALVAVADGIGSHPRAEVGAALAIRSIEKAFLSAKDPAAVSAASLIAAAAKALLDLAEREGIDAAAREKTLGTTLICAIQTPAEIRMAHLGNGAAFLIRPALLATEGHSAAHWAATNLLSPHAVGRNGKSALTRFLSAAGPGPATEPTVLTLGRDARHGEILLLCSDGFWSADELSFGTDDQGKVWQLSEPALARALDVLAPCASAVPPTEKELGSALQKLLAGLERDHLLDDDCTLAVLCTRGTGRAAA